MSGLSEEDEAAIAGIDGTNQSGGKDLQVCLKDRQVSRAALLNFIDGALKGTEQRHRSTKHSDILILTLHRRTIPSCDASACSGRRKPAHVEAESPPTAGCVFVLLEFPPSQT